MRTAHGMDIGCLRWDESRESHLAGSRLGQPRCQGRDLFHKAKRWTEDTRRTRRRRMRGARHPSPLASYFEGTAVGGLSVNSPSVSRLLQTLGLFESDSSDRARNAATQISTTFRTSAKNGAGGNDLEDQHTLAGRLRKNGMQVRAMLAHGGHKETATAFPNAAALADFEIEILPVGN